MKIELGWILNQVLTDLKNTPSYIIRSDKADEFVKKYNKQDKELKAATFVAALSCGFGAFLSAKEHKNLIAKIDFCLQESG